LKNLVDYFISIKDESDSENTNIEFAFEFEDGSSVRGSKSNVFSETESKKVKSASFSLRNYDLDMSIRVRIVTNLYAYYEIEGKNKDWVNSKFAQLEEIIKQIPNQNRFFSGFKSLLLMSIILGILIGISLYFIVSLISPGDKKLGLTTFIFGSGMGIFI